MAQGFHSLEMRPANPFRATPEAESAEVQYEQTARGLARHFIYDEGALDEGKIEQAIAAALRIPRLARLEQTEHKLESLRHLLKGIEAHERANLYHHGSWQATLKRQPSRKTASKSPELLTRDEVANEFAHFEFRDDAVDAERQTLEHYRGLLQLNPAASIRLSDNIRINHTDIEVLAIDIEVRMAERIPDQEQRTATLAALDRRLADIIQRIPGDERGKRFEMEEVYLLRRLIHAADKGHLASVSHGTPRADLRPDFGSVDIDVTAAGEIIAFQLKTFKRGVSKETKEKQANIIDIAHRRLANTPTHLVVLHAEAVQDAYETSLRQPTTARTSRADKYSALEPLVEGLHAHKQSRLLATLGLTEDDLVQEATEREHRQAEWTQHAEETRKKAALNAEVEARREEAARIERETKRERAIAIQREQEERIAEQERRLADEIRTRREAEAAVAKAKNIEREARLAEAAARTTEKRKIEEAAAAAAAEKVRKALERDAKKNETPDWPPKTIAGLTTPRILQHLGLLPSDWKNNAQEFLAAKKQFIALFAKPKRGSSQGNELDKPNEAFAKAFPTRERYDEKK